MVELSPELDYWTWCMFALIITFLLGTESTEKSSALPPLPAPRTRRAGNGADGREYFKREFIYTEYFTFNKKILFLKLHSVSKRILITSRAIIYRSQRSQRNIHNITFNITSFFFCRRRSCTRAKTRIQKCAAFC